MNYGNYKLSKIRATAIFLVILIAVFTGCAQNMAAKKDMEISPEPKLITEISTSEDSESFNVLVKGNRVLTYMSVKQPLPLAVLLYFPETALLDNIKTNISPESEIISSIKASELTEEGHKSRIEISLKKDVPYKAANEENSLKISFSKPSKALSSPSLSSSEPIEKPEEKAKKPAWVNRIDFSSEEAGKSTIIIGTTRPVEYKIKKASPQLLQLKLLNTRLPDYRKFPLITTRFESAVDKIIPVQTPAMENTSMLTIELRESVPYFIEQNKDLLLVHFEASTIAPKPLEDAKLPAWKEVMAQTVHKEENDEEKIEKEVEIVEKALEGVTSKKIYTGEKIALDFYETDIKNVFRILQEVSGKNFAIDKYVAGKVTLTLDKPVPWDQILDLVLKMNQLDKIFEGDIIRIATAETLKKEGEQHNELLKAKEEKKALQPLVTEYIPVNYSDAEKNIKPRIEDILTERGSVGADKRTNIIIITDVAEKINKAREIIKNLDKVTPQVIIEARIVEATSNFSREIGIEWDISSSGSHILGDRFPYSGNMAMNAPLTSSAMSIGFNFSKITGTPFLLDATLMAMESQGKAKIISAPKIVTLDNKKAIIQRGDKVPYPEKTAEGTISVEYAEATLKLEVTPHISDDKRINLIIDVQKDEPDWSKTVQEAPAIKTKNAHTELLVNDGDTIVIGGIIQTTKSFKDTGVPGLSKIPFLGWLFKSTDKEATKEELLIFITPKIVTLEQKGLES
ncbi:MAG: hypothetical protein DRH21_00570 [Deltaproteobacteria bacterium]|nr:MAG: hypothetical protein DRH21_00570 [Deltaproteobacteria bacterium]